MTDGVNHNSPEFNTNSPYQYAIDRNLGLSHIQATFITRREEKESSSPCRFATALDLKRRYLSMRDGNYCKAKTITEGLCLALKDRFRYIHIESDYKLVDYNLYGMSHIHMSKIKFRPPLPDSFVPKSSYKEKHDVKDDLCEEVGDSAIWLSSTVLSSLIWSDSVVSQSSSENILNEKYKIYTSLSQTSSEVKMVQSLIPIWEKSLPENAFATEDGDKLEEHIKSFIGIDQNSKSMGCQNSSNSSGEPLNHHEDKNDMLHGLLSKGQGDIFCMRKYLNLMNWQLAKGLHQHQVELKIKRLVRIGLYKCIDTWYANVYRCFNEEEKEGEEEGVVEK
ncbi:DNA polymerase [Musa troglodytarum]|uniref:DNA polymerase n=1 Tax=Musa troglodytarum TaxID=320322 RepID=A0A9E7ERW8_9LILI|nr:DNA polymerase [Musa troglodytarum]